LTKVSLQNVKKQRQKDY